MNPPVFPDPPPNLPPEVRRYLNDLVQQLRAYFRASADPETIGARNIIVPVDKFPTQGSLATLESGQMYRDTTTDNVKMKP